MFAMTCRRKKYQWQSSGRKKKKILNWEKYSDLEDPPPFRAQEFAKEFRDGGDEVEEDFAAEPSGLQMPDLDEFSVMGDEEEDFTSEPAGLQMTDVRDAVSQSSPPHRSLVRRMAIFEWDRAAK